MKNEVPWRRVAACVREMIKSEMESLGMVYKQKGGFKKENLVLQR